MRWPRDRWRPCRRSVHRPTLLQVEDVNTDLVQKEVFFTSSINISRQVGREIHAGTVWTDTWAAINDGFAEGGYKQSGIGRLRGPLAITEFQEAKTVVHAIPPFRVRP